jgi:hypothetical protein
MPSALAVAAVSSLHLETFPDAGKNVCDKPTQFDGVGAHGRSISIDLDRPDQPATIFRNPACPPSAKRRAVPGILTACP